MRGSSELGTLWIVAFSPTDAHHHGDDVAPTRRLLRPEDYPAVSPRGLDDPRLSPIHLRRELVAAGASDRSIARSVQAGDLHRLRYGSYVEGAAWRGCDSLGRHGLVARAAVRRAQADVVVSHLSALGEWDVPVWDLGMDDVHLTRTDDRAGRREAGVVQHLGELRPDDVVERHGVRVTSPTRTALDCLGLVDTAHGVTIVGDLLHRGLTSPEQLEAGRVFMAQWPGSLRHQIVTAIADGRCESPGEHRTLHLCRSQRLPRPVPQYVVRDRSSEVVARVDFAWPEQGVFCEFDGRVKYERLLMPGESASSVVVREKRREERICELTGWRCIRLTWADLYRERATALRLRRLLEPGSMAIA